MNIGLVNVVSHKDEDNIEKDLSEKQKMILDNLYRCRDLEFNNLWQKGVFLGPFLVLCFTGYGFLLYELVKEDGLKYQELLKYEKLLKYEQITETDTSIIKINILCIVLCAVSALFSILWILMFKGSKAQFELCERAIANYEQKELKIPYGYAMGTLRHNEIEFDDGLLNTKAGKFSPSKVNIVIGQVSLWIWIYCLLFHIGIYCGELGIAKMILIFLIIILFLCGTRCNLLLKIVFFFFGEKVRSSYLSPSNEEKGIREISRIVNKELNRKNKKRNRENIDDIINKNREIIDYFCEFYNIKNKEILNLIIFLEEKERIYHDTYRYLIESSKINISKKNTKVNLQKNNTTDSSQKDSIENRLFSFALSLGIKKEQVEKLNNYIREKYQR